MTVEHKFKTDAYRMIVNYTDYPICEVLRGAKTNFFIQTAIDTTKQIAGEIIDSCKRSGIFKVSNVTFLNTSMLALWPAGSYRVLYRFSDGNDGNIVNLTFEATFMRWCITITIVAKAFFNKSSNIPFIWCNQA